MQMQVSMAKLGGGEAGLDTICSIYLHVHAVRFLPLKENHFCKGLSSWLLNISVCWCCLGNFENFPRQNFPEV